MSEVLKWQMEMSLWFYNATQIHFIEGDDMNKLMNIFCRTSQVAFSDSDFHSTFFFIEILNVWQFIFDLSLLFEINLYFSYLHNALIFRYRTTQCVN